MPLARCRIVSPHAAALAGRAAIAVLQIEGDVSRLLGALDVPDVPVGASRLRHVKNADALVVARLAPALALVFPHGGAAVMHAVTTSLIAGGCEIEPSGSESITPATFAENGSLWERRLAAALANAASPLAIDLLLDQPRRWARAQGDAEHRHSAADSRTLRRLITPPTIAALGRPNIGKSSLLNALAGRGVAIVADEPGTTRDHIGIVLDLAGLAVRYIDTPGIAADARTDAADPVLIQAQHFAMQAVAAADLVLLCGDARHDFPQPPSDQSTLRVGLRADLGLTCQPADVSVCARTGEGLETLVTHIRDALVPPALIADPRAWAFWDDPEA